MDPNLIIFARILFMAGALAGFAGALSAGFRAAEAYKRAQIYDGSFGAFDDIYDQKKSLERAAREFRRAAVEFGCVGAGVVLSAVASLILLR